MTAGRVLVTGLEILGVCLLVRSVFRRSDSSSTGGGQGGELYANATNVYRGNAFCRVSDRLIGRPATGIPPQTAADRATTSRFPQPAFAREAHAGRE